MAKAKEEEKEVVPTFDLTLIEEGETGYVEILKTLCLTLAKGQNSVLQVYWDVGTLLHECVNDQIAQDEDRNLSEILRNLSKDIHTVSGGHLEYSDSTLRKMLTFRESISKEQLTSLKKLSVPISKALPMCIKDVTDDDRDAIIEELSTGATDTAQIPERVKELAPVEERNEPRGGAGPFKTIKKFNTTLDTLANLTEDELTLHTATVMDSEDEEAKVNFLNQMKIARNKINSLRRVFGVLCSAYLVGEYADEEVEEE